jgi:ferrochelatase
MLLGFGGPERAEEVRPFIRSVLKGRPVPEKRIEEVAGHYEAIGGASPIRELTNRQAEALRRELRRRGTATPVSVAMRNGRPPIEETLRAHLRDGARSILGLVMAPFQTRATLDYYRSAVEEARRVIGSGAPAVDYAPGLSESDGFVSANTELLVKVAAKIPESERYRVSLLFSAHSLPLSMPEVDYYRKQFRRAAERVSRAADFKTFRIAYQSRSGPPREKWLEPDVDGVIREEVAAGASGILVAPIGFVCDNVEVLYDLDVQAAGIARRTGLTLRRVPTAGDHPALIGSLADFVTYG